MNPCAAINDLLPFQGSPFGQLGYFSKCVELIQPFTLDSGEGGIRTHAPLRTNGFQDRLVMTTSIPLHIQPILSRCRCLFVASLSSARFIIYKHPLSVNNFFQLFLFFYFIFSEALENKGFQAYYFFKISAIFKSSGVVILIF